MEESDQDSESRQLRRSTLAHQPGRYAEMLVAGVERPAFTVPDPVFDPEPARHCAFPSIELDQYPGPSEQFIEARARGDWHGDHHLPVQYSDSDNEQDDYQGDRRALVAHLPPLDAENDEMGDEGIQAMSELPTPKRGQSFKEFCLSVTNGLDWGSPEPEPEPQQQMNEGLRGEYESNMDAMLQSESPPDSWDSISTGVQWAILSTLCQAHDFSVAVHRLNLTADQITTFIQTYIKCHEEVQDWCRKIDRMPVSDLIRRAEDGLHSVDEYIDLVRPRLPTDILFQHEIEQAGAFLRKSGHPELVDTIDKWRGTSTNFVELPINQDMLAHCRVKLYKSRGSNRVQDFQPIEDQEPENWLERFQEPEDFDNALCHFYNYYADPFALHHLLDPLLTQQPQLDANHGVPFDPSFAIERDESGQTLENVAGRPLLDYREPSVAEQQQLNLEQAIAQDLVTIGAQSQPPDNTTLRQLETHKTVQKPLGVVAPTKTGTAVLNHNASSRMPSSHRSRLFNKPAPGQQYTSVAAKRGTGSYTSPFIIDASESPESQPALGDLEAVVEESEPTHFEQMQVGQDQARTLEGAEVHGEAGSIMDRVPNQAPLEAPAMDMSHTSQLVPFDDENVIITPSRKRALTESDDEYEPQFDDGEPNDEDYKPRAAKKPRKTINKKPNARNKKMPAAQQARQPKQAKRQPKQAPLTMAKAAKERVATAAEAFQHGLADTPTANQAGVAPNVPTQAAQSTQFGMKQSVALQLSHSEHNPTPPLVPQPVKRGRGRPRKHPRPEDVAAQRVGVQTAGSQEPSNTAGTRLPTTTTTSKPTISKAKKKAAEIQPGSGPDSSALAAFAETFGPSSSSENFTAEAPTTMESSAELSTGNQSQAPKLKLKITNSRGQTQRCSPVPPPVLPPHAMPASRPQNSPKAQKGHFSYSQPIAQPAHRIQSRPAQPLSAEQMEYYKRNQKSAHEACFRPGANTHNLQGGAGYLAYRNAPFTAAVGTSMHMHQANAQAGGQIPRLGVSCQVQQASPQYFEDSRLGPEAGSHQATQTTGKQEAVQTASRPVQFPSVLRTFEQQVRSQAASQHSKSAKTKPTAEDLKKD